MKKWTPHRRDAALVRVERMTAGIATLGVLGAAALGYGLSTTAKAANDDTNDAPSNSTAADPTLEPQPVDPQADAIVLIDPTVTANSDDDAAQAAAKAAAKKAAAKKAAEQAAQQQAAQQQQQQQQQAPQQSNNGGGNGNKASSGGS